MEGSCNICLGSSTLKNLSSESPVFLDIMSTMINCLIGVGEIFPGKIAWIWRWWDTEIISKNFYDSLAFLVNHFIDLGVVHLLISSQLTHYHLGNVVVIWNYCFPNTFWFLPSISLYECYRTWFTRNQHRFGKLLGATRQQAITCNNVTQIL